MKTKAKSKNPKPAKLADLKARKDPKGGLNIGRNNKGLDRTGRGDGGSFQHNETFLAD